MAAHNAVAKTLHTVRGMNLYSIASSALILGLSTPEMRRLIKIGVAQVVDSSGEIVRPPGEGYGAHLIPEWVLAELVESPRYLKEALGR